MPIRPENRSRYPANWRALREEVMRRAGNACEGSPRYPDCRVPNGAYRNVVTEAWTHDPAVIADWLRHGQASVCVVLTCAHFDHVVEHCAFDNLRAWCQRCHLTHDSKQHAQTAYATRRRGRAMDLF